VARVKRKKTAPASSAAKRRADPVIVARGNSSESKIDFGHVDLFFARDAEQLVWTPIAQWLAQHAPATASETSRARARPH
jgi:hypothetical protein